MAASAAACCASLAAFCAAFAAAFSALRSTAVGSFFCGDAGTAGVFVLAASDELNKILCDRS